MLKFGGNKPLTVIKEQCAALGLEFDDFRFRKMGSDFVTIRGGGAEVIYNTFNGRFFGTTDKGVEFNSDEATHDKEPWMLALLRFFYLPKKRKAKKVPE